MSSYAEKYLQEDSCKPQKKLRSIFCVISRLDGIKDVCNNEIIMSN